MPRHACLCHLLAGCLAVTALPTRASPTETQVVWPPARARLATAVGAPQPGPAPASDHRQADPRDTAGIAGARLHFDLPAQPLTRALEAFGLQTGMSGFYRAETLAGHHAPALSGWYTADEALRLLVARTGLAIDYTASDAFVLEASGAPAPVPVDAGVPADAAMQALVQSSVRQAFCREPLLASGAWRIAVSFRIGPQGRIESPRLLSSTGQARRDQAVIAALARVETGQAPLDTASPFVMLVLPRAPGSPTECGPP